MRVQRLWYLGSDAGYMTARDLFLAGCRCIESCH